MPAYDFTHMSVEISLSGFGGLWGFSGLVHLDAATAVGRSDCLWEGKYFSMVAAPGGFVTSEPKIMQRAEPRTIGTTVINPFQKLTSPRGVKNKTLIASLPWPICQTTSPAL